MRSLAAKELSMTTYQLINAHCGTVTEIVHDGVSAMICCGKTMEVLDDREPVGTKESHMPVVEATEKGCKVSVGSKLHGMDADHLIEWAEIRTSDDTVLRKYFKAGETPVVEFPIPFDQVVFARAYCNKHGAWRAK